MSATLLNTEVNRGVLAATIVLPIVLTMKKYQKEIEEEALISLDEAAHENAQRHNFFVKHSNEL
jgi:hypothetical protein